MSHVLLDLDALLRIMSETRHSAVNKIVPRTILVHGLSKAMNCAIRAQMVSFLTFKFKSLQFIMLPILAPTIIISLNLIELKISLTYAITV